MDTQHSPISWRRPANFALAAGLAAIPLLAIAAAPAVASPGTTVPAALETEIENILELALAPGAIEWNCCGADAPPTGVNAAVRIPGRDDIVVAAGTNVDGTPFDPHGVYNAGNLEGLSLVPTIAWQLADEGILDLDASIDTWLPEQPNADRITVGMLADMTHGWGEPDAEALITADLTRRWTLAEVLDSAADIPPLGEPGTLVPETSTYGFTALAYIAEQVTGDTIAELIETRVVEPLGLDDTYLDDGTNVSPDFQHMVFALEGQRMDTSMVPSVVSYLTYLAADRAVVSTSNDLLDLLDAFVAGDLFTTDRMPGPDRFLGARRTEDGRAVYGLGIPLVGYCPCEPAGGDRLDVAAVGRRANALGTNIPMIRFDDGISVVLHFNSNDVADPNNIWPYVVAIHEAAATQP